MSEQAEGTEPGFTATGFARCEKPERYIQQLVKHWGHKMATSFDAGTGAFPFSEHILAVMTTRDEGIAFTLTTTDKEENERMRGVIERHVDRFAFREAPLAYTWEDNA